MLMSNELDIDSNVEAWLPALNSVLKKRVPRCPACDSDDVVSVVSALGKGVGYVVMTCNECKKSGYFSRVKLNGSARGIA